uniref:Uncharacterized protein n=1 Tax=Musca domestica TaxID=7370 RepID=A0A1I8NHM2_MUSDO
MQIFYNIVVLVLSCWCLWCSICFVAQSQSTAGRHPCVDSCNRTDIDVCATNGQNCKRFPSNCELQRDNCNLTLATGWNRTNSIECSYLQLNGTGLCACSPHGLRECSNRTVTPGICVHGGTGHRRQQCHLFGTECDLRRARCVGTEWHEIDNRQCRGFAVNQTNPCHCPKLVQCSSVSRLSCVQVNQSTCRLYGNECELERGRCDGERSSDVDILHCYKFQANQSQSCYCPALLNCQRNDTTNICVRNAAGRCQLLANNCDLERRKCIGEDLRPIHTIQCSNMTVNQQSSCFCPQLNTCSTSRRPICVRTRRGCKLFVSECQAEEARCRGEVLETLDPVQCHGFRDEEEKSCSCPKMSTCSTNQTSTCVRTSSSDCTLLRNECELERYKCQNPNPTILPAEQCRHIKPGERGSCNCPKWLTCSNSTTRLCVETNNGCELIQNECDLERRRCQGEVLNSVNIELCPNFRFGQVRPCFCPALKSCGQNSTSKINICVKGPTGCKLMHDNCELELAKCLGERWSIQDPIQCLGIALGNVGQCFCPEMEHCSHWGNSSICVRKHKQCKRLTNRCDLEKSICLEEVLPRH